MHLFKYLYFMIYINLFQGVSSSWFSSCGSPLFCLFCISLLLHFVITKFRFDGKRYQLWIKKRLNLKCKSKVVRNKNPYCFVVSMTELLSVGCISGSANVGVFFSKLKTLFSPLSTGWFQELIQIGFIAIHPM